MNRAWESIDAGEFDVQTGAAIQTHLPAQMLVRLHSERAAIGGPEEELVR